jgi:hypothetical protein
MIVNMIPHIAVGPTAALCADVRVQLRRVAQEIVQHLQPHSLQDLRMTGPS